MLGSTLPPHLSGASPTAYFCNNMVWPNIVETGKKIYEQKTKQIVEANEQQFEPITILNDEESGYTELHQASFMEGADERMLESVDYDQLDARDHNGNTPLMWASLNGNAQLVELLIDQGAAVNMQNFVGETALFIAAARGFDKICTLLVENGADTRFANIDGATPTHIAAAGGYVDVVKTLVSHGSFVNCVDEEGDTPLHYAVREGKKDIIELLVKYCGADFGIKNEDMETPFELAIELDERVIADFLSTCFSKNSSSADLPEYHLYFGEESEMQVSKKEHELPQNQVRMQGLFNNYVVSF